MTNETITSKERVGLKFSGLIGLLVEDENVQEIMDPIYGPIVGIKENVMILNVLVTKVPTAQELRHYLRKKRI